MRPAVKGYTIIKVAAFTWGIAEGQHASLTRFFDLATISIPHFFWALAQRSPIATLVPAKQVG